MVYCPSFELAYAKIVEENTVLSFVPHIDLAPVVVEIGDGFHDTKASPSLGVDGVGHTVQLIEKPCVG